MRALVSLSLTTVLLAAATGAAAQPIVNGDFSSGLTGWQIAGDGSVQGATGVPELWLTTASATFADDHPLDAGALNRSGAEPVTSAQLEALAGLAPAALDPDAGNAIQAYEGSAALQSFSAGAGDTLSFRWDFGTSDSFADYAFAVVDGQLFVLAGVGQATQPGRLGNLQQTGSNDFSFTFASSGSHTLAFGVVDVGDFSVTSTLAVQGVQVSAVPEPAALASMLAGLVVCAGALRRRA